MDERAISFATEENLRQLGLVAQGDIFALKAFVSDELSKRPSPTQEDSREQRKKMLIEKLVLGTKKVGGTNVTTTVKEKKAKVLQAAALKIKTRKVKLAWQHFSQEAKHFIMVRESTGGGQREMAIATTANQDEILTILIDLFFPNGNSTRGKSSEMQFFLGNFQGEVISGDGFTLGSYISINKLSKPRLYLLSKCKTRVTGSGTDDLVQVPAQSAFTPKQHEQDCNLKDHDKDDPMPLRPAFASTPILEGHDQHYVYEQAFSDSSDHDVVFKGFGSYLDDCPLLLDDTLMDPIIADLDNNEHSR